MIKNSDLLWIYLGCIIPDIPWIIRKIIELVLPIVNSYDLQIYSVVQSSLFFSLILSYCFALISKSTYRTFIILGLGSIFHLLFDMFQIKWANGVILFAPFNWDIINYGIFWPESVTTYLFTIIGFMYFFINWNVIKKAKLPIKTNIKGLLGFFTLLVLYFTAPIFLIENGKEADNHFVKTLENFDQRKGKYIELDRKALIYNDTTNSFWIESFDKSLIELSGIEIVENDRISIKGKFLSNNLIQVEEYHENLELFRDGASYVGLLFVLFAWSISFKNNYR